MAAPHGVAIAFEELVFIDRVRRAAPFPADDCAGIEVIAELVVPRVDVPGKVPKPSRRRDPLPFAP